MVLDGNSSELKPLHEERNAVTSGPNIMDACALETGVCPSVTCSCETAFPNKKVLGFHPPVWPGALRPLPLPKP